VLAATLFGVSTPPVQRAGVGVGPLTTAALVYAGAALLGALLRKPSEPEARVRRSDLPRLLAMACFGAVVGPVALAWGLQNTSGTSASLMLALEALFTAVLTRWLYHESMDRRVWTAMLLLLLGGMLLVFHRGAAGQTQLLGLMAVLLVTAGMGNRQQPLPWRGRARSGTGCVGKRVPRGAGGPSAGTGLA
jgi:drug/metabolite transporter (DMT)-like permease